MEIQYLKILSDHPSVTNKITGRVSYLEGISMEEILNLENTYNGGHPFPTALRELLFIGGKECYVLSYGLYQNQIELQQRQRKYLLKHGLQINRPFFVIDVYNEGDMFLFVYLDESQEDPMVHTVVFAGNGEGEWLLPLPSTLSQLISSCMDDYLRGENPF